MTSEPRSPRGRQLAEEALVRLAARVSTSRRDDLIIIGGLTPEFLTNDPPVQHQGTNDVDVLLSLGVIYDRDELDFAWLERALGEAGFTVDPVDTSGWRWLIALGEGVVKLELICDASPEESGILVPLPGCRTASAMNLHGPRAALHDTCIHALALPDDLGGGQLGLQFAGLAGYLLAKASAVVRRQEARDSYDFAFVLIHNTAGGPKAAADVILQNVDRQLLETRYLLDLDAVHQRFTDGDRPGAMTYAEEMRTAGDETDLDILVEDAAGAVADFWSELEDGIARAR